ncbi:hypothetical protein [Mycobacteroides abscessus]|uniref:hypothetical protein n=1 Tax=Mycobacteroides abscessus TaxID=36809 RepID=UPI000C256E10|nr:hypothetical protein [Mycobacteroides abscessus]
MFDDVARDVRTIRLPRWGRVVEVDDAVPWAVIGEDGQIVEPIRRFLLLRVRAAAVVALAECG